MADFAARLARLELAVGVDPLGECQGGFGACEDICSSEVCPAQQNSIQELRRSVARVQESLAQVQFLLQIVGERVLGPAGFEQAGTRSALLVHQQDLKQRYLAASETWKTLRGSSTNMTLLNSVHETLRDLEGEILGAQIALESLERGS